MESAAGSDSRIRIQFRAVETLSYALAHARQPVVDEVMITNDGAERRGVVVEITVADAMGVLVAPREIISDLGADGAQTVLRDPRVLLDPARMLRIEEQRPGRVEVTVRDGQDRGVIALASQDVTILAHHQWLAAPLELGLELLAAHVLPNAPVITTALTAASDLLRERTGTSSLATYQLDDPDRIDQIVGAIYDVFRGRNISYAEPPASWGDHGQKVRTPDEVLIGRLGTCLDITLTLAAVLEHCGVNSTLWLYPGHIVLGYWRTDSSLPTVAMVDPLQVVNLADDGHHLTLVETTTLTGGVASGSFEDACRSARQRLAGPEQVLGITDIRQAREHRIWPLPVRTTDDTGQPVVVEYVPPAPREIQPYLPSNDTSPGTGAKPTTPVPPRVANWKNALLDLSLRNRLINFTERSATELLVPEAALGRLEDLVNDERSISLIASDTLPQIDLQRGIRHARELPEPDRERLLAEKATVHLDLTGASYAESLRRLANRARTIVEETGANNLYLAFGTLQWNRGDRDLRSPLILVPVTLSTSNRGRVYRLSLDEAGASTPNYCLLESLQSSYGLEIPELETPAEDGSGINLDRAFQATRAAIAKAGLPFRVLPTAHLAILQFAKFRLWKDLDDNWQALASNPLVQHLIETHLEPFIDPVTAEVGDLDQLGLDCPVPADASQLTAISDAVAGRTFVLEGPPGTGKSQTITNLLARSLAEGRRVLFVAEKRAALDVVKQRLDAVGLGPFSLDLHDKGARPSAVRAQIKEALDLHPVHQDDEYRVMHERATTGLRTLGRYADRLHATNASGMSLYSARNRLLATESELSPIPVPGALVAHGPTEGITAVREALRLLPERSDAARPGPAHPWALLDPATAALLDPGAAHQVAQQFDAALETALDAGLPLAALDTMGSPDEVSRWARLAGAPRFPVEVLGHRPAAQWRRTADDLSQQIAELRDDADGWLPYFDPALVDEDVPSLLVTAQAADAAGFFVRKRRRREVLATITRWLRVEPKAVPHRKLTVIIGELARSREEVAELRSLVATLLPWQHVEALNPFHDDDVEQLNQQLDTVTWTSEQLAADPGPAAATILRHYAETPVRADHAGALDALAEAWRSLVSAVPIRPDLAGWLDGVGFLAAWRRGAVGRQIGSAEPVTLEAWVYLLRTVDPLRAHRLTEAHTAILAGQMDVDSAALMFDKGLAEASVAERRQSQSLDQFDVVAHTAGIRRFTESARDVRADLTTRIPAGMVDSREFNALASTGQIGALRRQLERRRGGMSVRQLLDTYGDIITRVMPCTLVSPESVARFFPATPGLFDIVVFDEASQIRVADAVGAMGRGRSVVVVGDSKQMPPTSFAQVTAGIEVDDLTLDTVADEESILSECVQAQVSRHALTWHYRSQDESLIAFSNHQYYDSLLSSFPSPRTSSGDPDGYGISFVRLPGQFARSGRGRLLRTNQVEADAIVAEVARRFNASPTDTPSLGIITFNAQQRDLIEDLLRDAADERITFALDEPDGLFVKNLENVQGDERDTILFSVAFSANDRGVVPLNFGPLTQAGGERRLNVAITRARRQIVLFASFDPADLRAENTSSIGIKHLKGYLEHAQAGAGTRQADGRRIMRTDRHRDDIADALRDAGLPVTTDVGLSDFRIDLSVADPDDHDRRLVAVLLDGPTWHGRRTVADRDSLPTEVLQRSMGWPAVERIWLPEWLADPAPVIARILAAVETAKAGTIQEVEPETPVDSGNPHTIEDPVSEEPVPDDPLLSTFRAWPVRERGSVSRLDALPGRQATQHVADTIGAVLDVEGPVHQARLAKLVGEAYGLSRVVAVRVEVILGAVPVACRGRGAEAEFVWPMSITPDSWRAVRRADGEPRDLAQVTVEEIANAMAFIAQESGGIDDGEARRAALDLFGGKRITAVIGQRLDAALQHGFDSGRVERAASGLITAEVNRTKQPT